MLIEYRGEVLPSLDIADTFEKEHKNVLADIRSIQEILVALNFQPYFMKQFIRIDTP